MNSKEEFLMAQDAHAVSSLAHTPIPPRALVTRRAKISELHSDPANARRHDERNLAAIADSLRTFGQVEPLVVQKATGRVIGGNGRLEVLRSSGAAECDIVEVDVNDTQAAALGIALNRTAELAEWDDQALTKILQSLPEDALSVTGFSNEDLNALIEELSPPQTAEDEVPEPLPEPVSRRGDLWIMDGHRLLCGDSTDLNDALRVMDGHKAALCSTDPPYLIDYTGERVGGSGKDWSATYHEVDIENADTFFRSLFTNVLKVIAPHAAIYCWHAHKRQHEIALIWRELGILDHQQVVWVKPASVFGSVYYHFRHEPCMMGWVKGSKPPHDGKHDYDSVWEVDWEGRGRVVGNEHPTQKPLELFARPMRKHTKPHDVCFEPFSGSGSQLIAAEQMKRRCFSIEVEPTFVDVAVRRWQNLTGHDAVLDGDGRTWAQVKAERTPTTLTITTEKTPTEAGVGSVNDGPH
jgi:DNA modification methylase